MKEHVLALETETPLQNKKRRLDSTGQGMNVLQKLKEENEFLKAKIGSLELHEDFPIPLEKKRQHESSISGETNQLMKMIEEKLSCGLNEIQTNVKKLINDKFNTMPINNTTPNTETHESNKSTTTTMLVHMQKLLVIKMVLQ